MKLDKELISRQRFWFCLGGFVLVWLIGLLTINVSASGQIKTRQDAYDSANKAIDNQRMGDPKNPNFWLPWEEVAKIFHHEAGVVHERATEIQKKLIILPNSERVKFQEDYDAAASTMDFRKRIEKDRDSTKDREDIKARLFKQQYVDLYNRINGTKEKDPRLDRILAPVEFNAVSNATGTVGSAEVGFKTIMMPTLESKTRVAGVIDSTGRTIDEFFEKTPSVEECWYAQEDFWLKSEILFAVRRTLDSVGKFNREETGLWSKLGYRAEHPDQPFSPHVKPEGKPEKGTAYVAESRYRNISWELHLLFEKDDASGKYYVSKNSTIRNVHPSQRFQAGSRRPNEKEKNPPLQFRVKQQPKPFILEVRTEDMPYNKLAGFNKAQEVTDDFDPTKPFEVEQIFDWYTAPIRRIDDIKTCINSHRTLSVQLKPNPVFSKPLEEKPADPNAPVTPPPPPNPNDPTSGPAAPGAPTTLPATEFNGLERNRYLNATDTCRDLPFAVVIVLEQPHLDDFLVQLANSNLRIQVTQDSFIRVRNVGPTADASAGGTRPPVGAPASGAAPTQPTDPNLVEVTVYGIAAMYEKFKKPEVKNTDPANPVPVKPDPAIPLPVKPDPAKPVPVKPVG